MGAGGKHLKPCRCVGIRVAAVESLTLYPIIDCRDLCVRPFFFMITLQKNIKSLFYYLYFRLSFIWWQFTMFVHGMVPYDSVNTSPVKRHRSWAPGLHIKRSPSWCHNMDFAQAAHLCFGALDLLDPPYVISLDMLVQIEIAQLYWYYYCTIFQQAAQIGHPNKSELFLRQWETGFSSFLHECWYLHSSVNSIEAV